MEILGRESQRGEKGRRQLVAGPPITDSDKAWEKPGWKSERLKPSYQLLDPQPRQQVILELAETKSYHRQKKGRARRERWIASRAVADLYIDTCEQLDNIIFWAVYNFVNLVPILFHDNGAL